MVLQAGLKIQNYLIMNTLLQGLQVSWTTHIQCACLTKLLRTDNPCNKHTHKIVVALEWLESHWNCVLYANIEPSIGSLTSCRDNQTLLPSNRPVQGTHWDTSETILHLLAHGAWRGQGPTEHRTDPWLSEGAKISCCHMAARVTRHKCLTSSPIVLPLCFITLPVPPCHGSSSSPDIQRHQHAKVPSRWQRHLDACSLPGPRNGLCCWRLWAWEQVH